MYEYSLKRSGRKTLSLEITSQLNILVRAPMRLPRREIDRFVESRSGWIASHLEKQRLRAEAGLSGDLSAAEVSILRDRALEVIPGRVRYYGKLMGLEPAGIRITGARTRFGSCSGKNRLCFSYRLMLYPPEAVDYVVVHELAHIRHKNHGPAFYALVAAILPDYKVRRNLLRQGTGSWQGGEKGRKLTMMVTLEQWVPDFVPAVAKHANNPGIAANLRDGFPQPYTQADAEAYIADCIGRGDDRQLCRAIVADGEAVGSIGVFLREHGEAELGYWLAEPFWGMGIMTRMVERICREAFARYELDRICAVPYVHNAASRRVLEKAGFVFRGFTESCNCSRGRVCRYTLDRPSAA